MGYAWAYIKNMFGLVHNHKILYEYAYYIDNIEILAFVAAILCAMPIFNKMLEVKYERKWLRAGNKYLVDDTVCLIDFHYCHFYL